MWIKKKHWYLLFILGIIIVLSRFSNTNYLHNIYENLDTSLQKYLNLHDIDTLNNMKSASDIGMTTPPCIVDKNIKAYYNNEFGYTWNVELKDNSVKQICVPKIFSDDNSYVPCNSPLINSKTPDISETSNVLGSVGSRYILGYNTCVQIGPEDKKNNERYKQTCLSKSPLYKNFSTSDIGCSHNQTRVFCNLESPDKL